MDEPTVICGECAILHEDNDPNHVYNYVDELLEDYQCTICLQPLQQPIDTPCGHTFCSFCIEPSIKLKKLCPNCRKPVCFSDLRPSTFLVRNILNKLRVSCPLCEEVVARQQLTPHLANNCPKQELSCKYECGLVLQRTFLPEHEAVCSFKDKKQVRRKSKIKIKENDTTTIEIIRRPTDRLGLTIYGGMDSSVKHIVIQEVIKHGICDRDGRLKVGDIILEVNNTCLRNVTHHQAFSCIDKASSPLKLLIHRPSTILSQHPCNDKTPPSNSTVPEELIIEPHVVELYKSPGEELGIRIMGLARDSGIKVLNLIEGSIAEKNGLIQRRDRILAVNGQNLSNVSQQTAADIIKRQKGAIRFLIQRTLALSECREMLAGYLTSLVSFKSNLITFNTDDTDTPDHISHHVFSFDTFQENQDSGRKGFSVAGGKGSIVGDIPVFVTFVHSNSPACLSGLKVGDNITMINDVNIADMSYLQVLTLLNNLNTDVLTVAVQRIKLDNPEDTNFICDWPFSLPSKGFGKLSVVTIQRNDAVSLGFRIVGGRGSQHGDLPIAIKSISRGSLASRSSLRPGDHMIGCNGHTLIGLSHDAAAQLIKNTHGDVKLTVLSWPNVAVDARRNNAVPGSAASNDYVTISGISSAESS